MSTLIPLSTLSLVLGDLALVGHLSEGTTFLMEVTQMTKRKTLKSITTMAEATFLT